MFYNILPVGYYNIWMLGLSLGLSLVTSEHNMAGVILGNGMIWTLIASDGLPLVWSLVSTLEIWEGLLLVIVARGT